MLRRSHCCWLLLLRLRERAVVLLDELAELLRHFVGAGHQRAIGVVADLAAQVVLEALHAFGDERLQALELVDVAIDAAVFELAQRAEDLVELAWHRGSARAACRAAARALAGPAARFVAELTDVFGR